jgi:curved DNA-binding protein CbpA
MKDLYYILGTDRDCTTSELNAAYQKLAQKLEPGADEHDHFLENHLQEISEAYQVLSDPDRRRKYDAAFKKNYQRRLYYFKIKHLNIAATLALLLFTVLFALYVIKVISGDKTKYNIKANKEVKTEAIVPAKITHHKKRHLARAAPAINKPPMVKPDTTTGKIIKPRPIADNKIAEDRKTGDPSGPTYDSYLKSNVTGLIYLRELDNYTSPVVAKIPDHAKVTILEKGAGFYKVAFNGHTGYVPKWTVLTP